MARMIIIVEAVEAADPLLTDPHEIAEDVVYCYNESQRVNGWPIIEFVSAEWVD